MKFTNSLVAFALVATAASLPLRKRDVNPDLVPQFQWVSGINPTGSGDCDGAVDGSNGEAIKIPCACPPDRDTFIASLNANVAAGEAVNNPTVKLTFPEDDSNDSAITRMQASLVTLQNLNGSGQGCPAVSTTYNAQLAALQQGLPPPPAPVIPGSASSAAPAAPSSTAPAAPSSSAPAAPGNSCPAAAPPASTTASIPASTTVSTPASSTDSAAAPSFSPGTPATDLSFDQIDSLTPQFGHAAGVNPDGTGNCDGAVIGSNGKPVQVPCTCPPDRTLFINDLIANIANGGHSVNNTVVSFTFPTDDSADSQHARFNAASDTLQNLFGPGAGCPIASTTWQAQNAAIQG